MIYSVVFAIIFYWGVLFVLSYFKINRVDVSQNKTLRRRDIDVGSDFFEQLFGGKLFSPRILVFDFQSAPVRNGLDKYIADLPKLKKISLMVNIADVNQYKNNISF